MERFFTILWLVLIPTQLGRHFWLSESSVMGVRIDYLSIIFYLTDVAWIGWVWTQRKKIKFKTNFWSLLMILLMVVNIILAPARLVATYRWLRIWQWWLSWQLVKKNKTKIMDYLMRIIPFWIILEAFLGLAQVVKGGSLNGIWWWLGERRFIYGGIGIAQMSLLDEAWIRAYGTFSHPNSLAGFLLLAWWFWKSNLPPAPFFDKTGVRKILLNKIWYWVVNWSAILGIILSGSRTVWALTVGLLITEQILKSKAQSLRKIIGKILLFSGIIMLVLGVVNINYNIGDFMGGWDTQSFQKREMLGLAAVRMIKSSPLFGSGAGNFVVSLPKFQERGFYWMQPVHNIFLLAWTEIGILGMIALIFNSKKLIYCLWVKKYWWIWVIVGVTGMLDHYWLTLPQNGWLLAVVLGLI